MIERLDEMPEGVVGFRAWGSFTREEYEEVLLPWMREAVGDDDGVRLLFQMGPDFERFTPGALMADITKGLPVGLRHLKAFHRMALVTDVGWARHAVELLGWMAPGELRLFALGELDDAKLWLAADGPDATPAPAEADA